MRGGGRFRAPQERPNGAQVDRLITAAGGGLLGRLKSASSCRHKTDVPPPTEEEFIGDVAEAVSAAVAAVLRNQEPDRLARVTEERRPDRADSGPGPAGRRADVRRPGRADIEGPRRRGPCRAGAARSTGALRVRLTIRGGRRDDRLRLRARPAHSRAEVGQVVRASSAPVTVEAFADPAPP